MDPSRIGFPAQPRQAQLGRLVAELRRRADVAREEAVTGLRADPARALGGRIGELVDLERTLGMTAQYLQIIDLAETRANLMQGTLDALRGLAVQISVSGQAALDAGSSAPRAAVAAEAREALAAAVAGLNVQFGGRSLFAGDAGDRAALVPAGTMLAALRPLVEAAPTGGQAHADLTVAFTAAGGLFETDFYTGGAGDAPAAEIAAGERLTYAARADAEPVRLLLRDLAALALAFDPETAIDDEARRRLAENAIAGLRNNVQDLTAMAARLGTAQERLATVRARHEAQQAALNEGYMRLAGRDQYEAAAEVTSLEAQLETSYLATVRLSRLSLANFLR